MEFQTIFAGVRPARVAILIDRTHVDWASSVEFVIEFLTQLWGGEHFVLVPTDGKTIEPRFWDLLEAFDPDYVYTYQERYETISFGIQIRSMLKLLKKFEIGRRRMQARMSRWFVKKSKKRC